MKRRTYLISAATLVATTGCLNGATDDSGSDGGTPTDSGNGTGNGSDGGTQTPEPSTVVVRQSTVQPAYVQLGTPDSIGVFGGDEQQYYLVEVAHQDGPVPSLSDYALTVNGEDYSPTELQGLWIGGDYGVRYDQGEGNGWLVFELPAELDVEEATVSWPGGEWPVPKPVGERFARPPATFDVTFEAPDTVAEGETPTLSMTVENTADVAGRFVFAMNRVGPDVAYAPVRSGVLELDPGQSVTEEWDGKAPTADREVTYHLRTKNQERISRTITQAE